MSQMPPSASGSSPASSGGGVFAGAPVQVARRKRGFRKRSALDQHSMHFGPNMTPMVDVVMVILIFFMASAAFLGSEWFLRGAIPSEAGRGSGANKAVDPLQVPVSKLDMVMDVDANGKTVVSFLQISRGTMEDVAARLETLKPDESTKKLEVVIRPSPNVPYRDVVWMHAACDAAGIEKVGYGQSKTPG